ncbi:MAG: hypothetical protein Q9174_006234, partial [Haloplaca sp. 1 TL-2023]
AGTIHMGLERGFGKNGKSLWHVEVDLHSFFTGQEFLAVPPTLAKVYFDVHVSHMWSMM